ncbi:MAG TPA: BON domain-containing protein [Ktedonobacteraceae bacterium]|nr:BON domain-containing protein [Ktedonobacteraceae bacterium]
METSLQSVNLTADDLARSFELNQAAAEEEAAHHVHLPNPSFWPLILSVAILVTMAGLLSLPDIPWLSIIGTPFILVGIMGWALEDPMAPKQHEERERPIAIIPANSAAAQAVLQRARDVADRIVTVSSTEYSVHPVKVEIEDDGIILALYGKVELEAQRQRLEDALLSIPGVTGIRNFIVAEDTILETAHARIEKLQSQGKLEGASNISILVENYILHLYGNVPGPEMKHMLERELLGIPGVRVVVNHIGLNKDIPGNLGRTINKIGG